MLKDRWIDWKGGNCPVDTQAKVEVRFSGDTKAQGPAPACAWRWDWLARGTGGDIIAYRLAEPVVNISTITGSDGKTHVVDPTPGETQRPGDVDGAKKMDFGKAPLMQGFLRYFPNGIFAVAMVSEYGDRKYSVGEHYTDQWIKLPDGLNRYGDAEARHLIKPFATGPYDDHDSGLPHLAQKAWNAMAELERAIRDGVIEVRRGNDIKDGKPVLGTARAVKL